MKLAEKVFNARKNLNLSQKELGDLVGVTQRSIAAYETDGRIPRGRTARQLAKVLGVSVDYLLNDDIVDPYYGIGKAPFVEDVRKQCGDKAAKELDALLEQNLAFFAGGQMEQETKDEFFEALMRAYLTSKEDARLKFGRKTGVKSQST